MYEKLQHLKWLDGMLIVGLGLVAVGIGLNLKDNMNKSSSTLIKAKVSPTVAQVYSKVVFEVSGEVVKPGVYELDKNGRVGEAINLAGGLAVNADKEWVEKNINKAAVIRDGEKIYVPKIMDIGQAQGSPVPVGAGLVPAQILGNIIINLNTASVEELDKLSGVGPAIAQKIIDYREKNGGFKDINEIKLVSGIGDSIFEKIKDKIGI